MITTARTLVLQRLLQQTTGGNATDKNGVGPPPADYGPALRTAYATGKFDFCSRGPPCKAFRKARPEATKDKTLRCELRLQFAVPAAHDDCHLMLEIIIREFNWLAGAYFAQLGKHDPRQRFVYRQRFTANDVDILMGQAGRTLRAIESGE